MSISATPVRFRQRIPGFGLLALLLAAAPATATIVSEQTAQQAGLTRMWYSQAPINSAVQHVVRAELVDGSLYVLGSSGVLTSLNAETGEVQWTTRCGDSSQPAFDLSVHQWIDTRGAGVDEQRTRCGVIAGSMIYVLDGENGEILYNRYADGAAGGAPAITEKFAFVPKATGILIGYPFDRLGGKRVRVAAPGYLLDSPLLASNRVIWTTAQGEVYGADAKTARPAFSYDTKAPIAGSPDVADEAIFFANSAGFVYALEAGKGRTLWRKSTGVTIEKPTVVIDDTVYVAAETPTLYAMDVQDGSRRWRVDGLSEVVSVSEDRVYAVNAKGALAVLDRSVGEPLASWPEIGELHPVANRENDRLYFVGKDGLIQCLRDERLVEPYWHTAPPTEEDPETPADQPETPAEPTPDAPAPADDPFADPFAGGGDDQPEEAATEEAEDDPFGADDPFGGDDPFGEDDPFGF